MSDNQRAEMNADRGADVLSIGRSAGGCGEAAGIQTMVSVVASGEGRAAERAAREAAGGQNRRAHASDGIPPSRFSLNPSGVGQNIFRNNFPEICPSVPPKFFGSGKLSGERPLKPMA
jgi:hypothetical protein